MRAIQDHRDGIGLAAYMSQVRIRMGQGPTVTAQSIYAGKVWIPFEVCALLRLSMRIWCPRFPRKSEVDQIYPSDAR